MNDFSGTVHLVDGGVTLDKYLAICQQAYTTRSAVCFAPEHAGDGPMLADVVETYHPAVSLQIRTREAPFRLSMPVTDAYVIPEGGRFDDPRPYGRHEGVDIVARTGTRTAFVLASADGIVHELGVSSKGYGIYLQIQHEQGFYCWYANLDSYAVLEGEWVKRGQVIGTAARAPGAVDPHVHLTVQHAEHGRDGYVVDKVVDPALILDLAELRVNGYSLAPGG